jgi:hypothetical protein
MKTIYKIAGYPWRLIAIVCNHTEPFTNNMNVVVRFIILFSLLSFIVLGIPHLINYIFNIDILFTYVILMTLSHFAYEKSDWKQKN